MSSFSVQQWEKSLLLRGVQALVKRFLCCCFDRIIRCNTVKYCCAHSMICLSYPQDISLAAGEFHVFIGRNDTRQIYYDIISSILDLFDNLTYITIHFVFSFAVLIEAISSLRIVPHSLYNNLASSRSNSSALTKSSIQYSVS